VVAGQHLRMIIQHSVMTAISLLDVNIAKRWSPWCQTCYGISELLPASANSKPLTSPHPASHETIHPCLRPSAGQPPGLVSKGIASMVDLLCAVRQSSRVARVM
jgi:hypothetical protein